jgi:hypothetical protein
MNDQLLLVIGETRQADALLHALGLQIDATKASASWLHLEQLPDPVAFQYVCNNIAATPDVLTGKRRPLALVIFDTVPDSVAFVQTHLMPLHFITWIVVHEVDVTNTSTAQEVTDTIMHYRPKIQNTWILNSSANMLYAFATSSKTVPALSRPLTSSSPSGTTMSAPMESIRDFITLIDTLFERHVIGEARDVLSKTSCHYFQRNGVGCPNIMFIARYIAEQVNKLNNDRLRASIKAAADGNTDATIAPAIKFVRQCLDTMVRTVEQQQRGDPTMTLLDGTVWDFNRNIALFKDKVQSVRDCVDIKKLALQQSNNNNNNVDRRWFFETLYRMLTVTKHSTGTPANLRMGDDTSAEQSIAPSQVERLRGLLEQADLLLPSSSTANDPLSNMMERNVVLYQKAIAQFQQWLEQNERSTVAESALRVHAVLFAHLEREFADITASELTRDTFDDVFRTVMLNYGELEWVAPGQAPVGADGAAGTIFRHLFVLFRASIQTSPPPPPSSSSSSSSSSTTSDGNATLGPDQAVIHHITSLLCVVVMVHWLTLIKVKLDATWKPNVPPTSTVLAIVEHARLTWLVRALDDLVDSVVACTPAPSVRTVVADIVQSAERNAVAMVTDLATRIPTEYREQRAFLAFQYTYNVVQHLETNLTNNPVRQMMVQNTKTQYDTLPLLDQWLDRVQLAHVAQTMFVQTWSDQVDATESVDFYQATLARLCLDASQVVIRRWLRQGATVDVRRQVQHNQVTTMLTQTERSFVGVLDNGGVLKRVRELWSALEGLIHASESVQNMYDIIMTCRPHETVSVQDTASVGWSELNVDVQWLYRDGEQQARGHWMLDAGDADNSKSSTALRSRSARHSKKIWREHTLQH